MGVLKEVERIPKMLAKGGLTMNFTAVVLGGGRPRHRVTTQIKKT